MVRTTGHPLPLPVSASSQVLGCEQAWPRPHPSRPVHHNREVFMREERNEGWKGEIRGEQRACLPSPWLSNNLLFKLWWMERQGPGSPLHAWKIGIWRQSEKYLREVLVKQPPTHNFVCSIFSPRSFVSVSLSLLTLSPFCANGFGAVNSSITLIKKTSLTYYHINASAPAQSSTMHWPSGGRLRVCERGHVCKCVCKWTNV